MLLLQNAFARRQLTQLRVRLVIDVHYERRATRVKPEKQTLLMRRELDAQSPEEQ